MESQMITLQLTTELEHQLYHYYSEEKLKRQELQSMVTDLKTQVKYLKESLKELQNKPATRENVDVNKNSSKTVEFTTDDEELAKETEWIRMKSRKKRKLNTSITPPKPAANEKEHGVEKPKRSPPPPPIVVEGVNNYQSFYDSINQNANIQPDESFTVKMLGGNSVKINAKNGDSYREITKIITSNKLHWYSYENKQVRPLRVVVKKLHHTCEPQRIVEFLKNKGFKIQNAVNKLSWKKKEPLNMFILSFENDEEVKKVYGISNILGCKVEIHPLKTSKLVPQCKRCQAYGHTQKYCSKEPRCVKCTGKHLTKDCQKPMEEKPKCVHCGESHPANYRGCIVAKEMQDIKNRQNKKQPTAQPKPVASQSTKVKNPTENSLNGRPLSYSQAVKGKTEMSLESKLDKMLSLMSSFDERLQKLETSAKLATKKKQK